MDVFRYFGRSRNALDPTISGMFGLGTKSFFRLVGEKGSMIIHTKCRETGECYRMYARKVGFDVLPNEDRGYGTSFTFVHDPDLNKYEVLNAIYDYSRCVRVPINFSTTGNSVTVDKPNYIPYWNEPQQVIIKPVGPMMISKISPEALLDKKVKSSLREEYNCGNSIELIKISYSTELYDFYGLITLNRDCGGYLDSLRNLLNTSLILISMPTENINLRYFTEAVVRIKSETGPDWLPRPTPDRERFEEKSKEAFMNKLNADIMERLPTITGKSIFYSGSGTDLARNEFKGIGKIVSYRSLFDMSETQNIIWRYIFTDYDLRKHLTPQEEQIVNQLCQEVIPWDKEFYKNIKCELHTAIEIALQNNSHVYLAPANARRSKTMREKANAADMHGIVLLGLSQSSLPQSLLDELPVFRDLSEIKEYSKERMPDHVVFHEIEKDEYKKIYRLSKCQKTLKSLGELEKNQAVAFRKGDNINTFLELLQAPSHTCPVGLFKATQAQIKWIQANTQILSLRDYIPWAREQNLATSRGPMKLDHLLSNSSTIFHSIGETAGSRLLNYFKNQPEIYVPLTGEDYFMIAAAIHFSIPKADNSISHQAYQPRIYNSIDLIQHLHMGDKDAGRWLDNAEERKGLWLYSHLLLSESNDLNAIDSIIESAPLEALAWIIDFIVKSNVTTEQHKGMEGIRITGRASEGAD